MTTFSAEEKSFFYEELLAKLGAILQGETDEIARMSTAACLLSELPHVFWAGFYRVTAPQMLTVGPYMGTLGCLRIPFSRGVCGACARTQKPIRVANVDDFPGHIACDSCTKSEIVVPVFAKSGSLLAVLDLDSAEANAFDQVDEDALVQVAQLVTGS